ncbi:hypothetical protein GCM10009663_15840 [Kitasatospora arboriphila]|uniref:Uncharacterized protein n=1 Tax=Kitasatospora arboriphila TaxID=258052 RepID=A0ABN1TCX3_9ACTN
MHPDEHLAGAGDRADGLGRDEDVGGAEGLLDDGAQGVLLVAAGVRRDGPADRFGVHRRNHVRDDEWLIDSIRCPIVSRWWAGG